MEEVSAKCQHHPVIRSEMKDELQWKSNHRQHGSNLYFISKGFQIKIKTKYILQIKNYLERKIIISK